MKEEIKVDVKKSWFKKFLDCFKSSEKVKIENVTNSSINIKIK